MASHPIVWNPLKCAFFFYYATEKDKLQNFPAVWQNKTGPNDRKKNIQTEIWPRDLEGDYLVESDSFCILHIYVHHKTLNAAGQYNRIKICVNVFMTNENLVVMKRESLMQV